MTTPTLTFAVWRAVLRQDCAGKGKLTEFESLGDGCLQLLWEAGIEPSVQAIAEYRDEDEMREEKQWSKPEANIPLSASQPR